MKCSAGFMGFCEVLCRIVMLVTNVDVYLTCVMWSVLVMQEEEDEEDRGEESPKTEEEEKETMPPYDADTQKLIEGTDWTLAVSCVCMQL